jgi:hypothetical protein
VKHLWEVDHPYYGTEGNYYSAECSNNYDSWAEFAETAFCSGDPDMNMVYRWDWISWRRHPDPHLRSESADELLLFFMLQRKAIACSASIAITDEDEPAVRAWLTERAKTITAVWEPITLTGGEQA